MSRNPDHPRKQSWETGSRSASSAQPPGSVGDRKAGVGADVARHVPKPVT